MIDLGLYGFLKVPLKLIMYEIKYDMWTVHCRFLVPENSTKILMVIWHQFWDKNDGEKWCHWNYFQIPRALSELPAKWPGLTSLFGWIGFENNFNGTTFHHHFCLKTGVSRNGLSLAYSERDTSTVLREYCLSWLAIISPSQLRQKSSYYVKMLSLPIWCKKWAESKVVPALTWGFINSNKKTPKTHLIIRPKFAHAIQISWLHSI